MEAWKLTLLLLDGLKRRFDQVYRGRGERCPLSVDEWLKSPSSTSIREFANTFEMVHFRAASRRLA